RGRVPGPGSKHGIYVYDGGSGEWRLLRDGGDPFTPEELGEGVVLVYFDNALCPACRLQDHYWLDVVKKHGGRGGVKFVVVLCDWFTQNCNSEAASKSFEAFKISSSPTIAVFAVKNGKVVYQEFLEGVRPKEIIELYLNKAVKEVSG
ncbi:MAG: thioredoxin family protein, partial [Aeropyrum sp.]|nr:thioredoxin family protein [Aeropyrum sp.]